MKALLKPLEELADYESIYKNRMEEPGMIKISGCVNSQNSHLMWGLSQDVKYCLILCANETKAKETYEEISILRENTYLYPAKDLLFYQADLRSKELTCERMKVLEVLSREEACTVVTTVDAFMDHLISKEKLQLKTICISYDETLELQKLEEKLASFGYDREEQISAPGQFAVRGGILDIFPLTEDNPIRIEFWGDEVDSIRSFEVDSQRSIENLTEVVIAPAEENGDESNSVSFWNYFPEEETLLLLNEPVRILENGDQIEAEYADAMEKRNEEQHAAVFSMKDILSQMNHYASIGFFSLDMKVKGLKMRESYGIQAQPVGSYNGSFDTLTLDLKKWKRKGYRVVLLSGSRTRARRLAEDLRDYDLKSFYTDDLERTVEPGEILTAYGHVSEGYEYPMIKFVVISETDIFGHRKKKKRKKLYEGRKIRDFSDLKPGDYVVHVNHGLGIYQGIEKIVVDKISKDYMKIAYAQGGNLYIPATQLDMIQKYASADAKKPKLNKLGTQEWHRTKTKVRGAVWEIAKDLVKLYAARLEQKGFEYGKDTVWQQEFEEMFPFEETEDQLTAIEAVKQDMESTKIMDRLICGDVGFGKTEVAIRAAFKAVQESKQVVYLVPTTILAQQHYNTFVQRMKDFPVRIDLLCRFRTPKEQKKTLEDTKKGLVDIVIGTHRVLSKDLEFKDLGLLIIDEEQRFGVQHKEKIKILKKNVDVLTLTATPIPRTLHMSLVGIRDMSVLEEAPNDRMPIQTYVMEYNEEMVREAIERECARDGQVYYVYNRVEDIADVAGRIKKLVPDANVAYAHGQMREQQLEEIMYGFINREIDVLVSTTIIETGLDISNANTMIIHDADRLGLSQLYQLRGRVGRSNRMAYAFLLYRRDKMLKEVAEKRLAAIREFTDLGSGFKIAMRDLEIRGAGNLLGERQHGHMQAVGYDMYCKMLNEAVRHLKGETELEEEYMTTMDLNVDAYIPESYIKNEYQKLDIYKRIATIENDREMEDMLEELTDRFGDPPKKVECLLQVAAVKVKAHNLYVTSVEQKGEVYTFTMLEQAKVLPERIPKLIESYHGDLVFKSDNGVPTFIYEKRKKNLKAKPESPIEVVKNILNDFQGLLEA